MLYSWDDGAKGWKRHGKIIHKANDPSKQETETISFAGFKHRFQLREQEVELSHIDQARLKLILNDGQTVTLAPTDPRLTSEDRADVLIYPGTSAEVVFDPVGIAPDKVKESILAVTGYYRPYSSIVADRVRASARQEGNGLQPGAK